MGNTFSHYVYWMANEISQDAEKRRKAQRDKLWKTNPDFRKLVPTPQCPHCCCRLDQEDPSLSKLNQDVKKPTKKPLLKPILVEKHNEFRIENELEIEYGLARESAKSVDLDPSPSSPKPNAGINLLTVAEGVYWQKVNNYPS